MNINKDNYEEFFLLFADNELSDQEKNIVEAFVKEHADLEEEFLNIKQSILKPENDLKLEDKSSLFRHAKKIINHTNYQEIFVLYIDDELTRPERRETEAFLLETPSLKNEFEAFQKTKLQPDNAIVFPDKNLLFPNKKLLFEREDRGKVVLFKWWKVVAAAVLLGMGIWIGIEFQNKNTKEASLTVKSNIPEKLRKTISIPTDTVYIQQAKPVAIKNPDRHPLQQKSLLQKNTNKLPLKNNDVNDQVIKNQKQTNNLPEISNMPDRTAKEPLNNIAKEVQKNNDNVVKGNIDIDNNDNNEVKQDQIADNSKNKVPDAITTSYTAEESENNNNYAFLNISEEKFNKSKVGGFLRKVKRIIERKISPLNNSKSQREVAVN